MSRSRSTETETLLAGNLGGMFSAEVTLKYIYISAPILEKKLATKPEPLISTPDLFPAL